MKLASFVVGAEASYGIVSGHGVIDVGSRAPGTVLADLLGDPAAFERHAHRTPDHALADVVLLPPVPDSRRIVCVGLNYKSHIAETGRETPAYPMLFPRYPDSLVGSGQAMVRPRVSARFDFEGEMAFVIGKAGRAIPRERALEHVAGYTCMNDGSIRDFQRHTSQFMPGKNFPGSGACGPWLVTAGAMPDIAAERIETRLNGAVMQSAPLDDLLFDVADLVAYLSTIWTVRPGDVVATGTTGGVGLFRDPPLWMAPGDVVEVSVTGIGTLTNVIVAEDGETAAR